MRTTASRALRWLIGLSAVLVLASGLSFGLLVLRAELTGRGAFFFLVWNLVLAWIPYVLALALAGLHARRGPRVLLWLLGIAWLLFLPNAPYILTDFIHLGRNGGAPLWFDAALLGAFASTGLLLGLASLLVVHRVIDARAGRAAGWVVAVASLGLSALGVYLGRFPRFNSWDVVTDLQGLVAVVLDRLANPLGNPFLIGFAAVMSLILVGSYLLVWAIGRGLVEPARATSEVGS